MEYIVNIHEAKTQLSKLVTLAQQGEIVTVAIHGRPVVRLVSIRLQPKFRLGMDECPAVPWEAFAPMSDEEATARQFITKSRSGKQPAFAGIATDVAAAVAAQGFSDLPITLRHA